MVPVEVRQGTLDVAARGYGPAGNTGCGCSLWAREKEEKEKKEEKTTHIKSNNPHLTGG